MDKNNKNEQQKISSVEYPISNLEKALTRVGVSISPINRERLLKIVSTTHYSTNRIRKFIKKYPFRLSDALDCLEICSEYKAGLKNIEHLLNVGYSTPQIHDLMELREDILPYLKPRKIWDGEDYKFIPPDLSGYISYQNLLFLDEIAGGTHDVEDIRRLIDQIDDRIIVASERGIPQEGIGTIIYRMRQMYNQKSEGGYTSSFNLLLNSALCYIPGRRD